MERVTKIRQRGVIRSEYKTCPKHLSSQLKVTPKRFWSHHSIKAKSRRPPDLNAYNRRSATTLQEQANLFNIHFKFTQLFTNRVLGYHPQYKLTDKMQVFIDVFTNQVTCNTKEFQKLLNHLNANKSCAVDKIPARLLNETADTSEVPLSMLFNLSFTEIGTPNQLILIN